MGKYMQKITIKTKVLEIGKHLAIFQTLVGQLWLILLTRISI
jgi:hypothetical protein